MTELADIRKNYAYASLSESDVARNPVEQFSRWFEQARKSGIAEPNAMSVATVGADLRPSTRIVLIKGFDVRGFVFFTNYLSRKGQELEIHPFACLLFHWVELERQVRIEGRIVKTSAADSDAYYASRPLGSRIGAWASEQSTVVPERETLEAQESAFREKFGESPPRPAHWGGYRLIPDTFEFWQGRPSRLHDRIRYRRMPEATSPSGADSASAVSADPGYGSTLWEIDRLSP